MFCRLFSYYKNVFSSAFRCQTINAKAETFKNIQIKEFLHEVLYFIKYNENDDDFSFYDDDDDAN
jgi:hypothetical protein